MSHQLVPSLQNIIMLVCLLLFNVVVSAKVRIFNFILLAYLLQLSSHDTYFLDDCFPFLFLCTLLGRVNLYAKIECEISHGIPVYLSIS